ncbi:hypothetical protein RRG08_022944 [Elysia crispata]|uniref:Uncharacterized protein n=1 Tax=Elysia crispata TaxID=231223 RepID=A0AAE1DKJ0_9GAST|nr:hypothetical protein RRG08_022944 [Elysia crispata]
MTVDLRSRQRSDNGTPRRIGEELSTMTNTSKRDDGEKPDGVTVKNHGTRLGKKLKAYAPTSSSEIEDAEESYAALQHAMENIHKQDILYILGDFMLKSDMQCHVKKKM